VSILAILIESGGLDFGATVSTTATPREGRML